VQFVAHLLVVRLLPVSSLSLWAVYTLVPMDDTPKGHTEKLYWRKTRCE
jgi:hypothetical protein